jgi:hypothetical protein
MKDMQEYVGKEILGFKFEDTFYVDYDDYAHNKYIGEVGLIVEVEKDNDEGHHSCRVEFANGVDDLWYPMDDIDKFIIEPIELDQLFKNISKL